MRIAIHLGVHCTDDERMLRCLQANADKLGADGIAVPGPDLYRNTLRDASMALAGAPASAETEELMLEQILDEDAPSAMVLSWDNFLSFPQWALRSRLYPKGAERVRELRQLFPTHDVQFFMAIRNPATYLPDLCSRIRNRPTADIMGGCDVQSLRWSEVIEDILSRSPGVKLTVWCDEDAPLIWPEVLAAVTGLPDGTQLTGWDDLLQQLLVDEGLRRLQSTLSEPPLPDLAGRRRLIGNLLGEFVRPETVEAEFVMEGWTQALVDDLTARYDDDVTRIERMPGVTFITP